MDPPEVEARHDTHEIPLATIDEGSTSANYAGNQDQSSRNANVTAERSPVPPQANTLTLERTQRSRESAQFVTPSSSSNIISNNPSENISNSNVSNNDISIVSNSQDNTTTNIPNRNSTSRHSRVINTRLNQSLVSNVTNNTTNTFLTFVSTTIASISGPALGLTLGTLSLAIINATMPSITESMLDSVVSSPIPIVAHSVRSCGNWRSFRSDVNPVQTSNS